MTVSLTSQTGGEHLICLETNTTNWFGRTRTFRFDLKVEFGEGATDYQELAKQEHLTAIEVELRKLNDKVKSIYAEQNYQKVCGLLLADVGIVVVRILLVAGFAFSFVLLLFSFCLFCCCLF
jgi:hypothetical protein